MKPYDLQKAKEYFQARVAFTTGVHELQVMTETGRGAASVIDVRYPADFAQGHVL